MCLPLSTTGIERIFSSQPAMCPDGRVLPPPPAPPTISVVNKTEVENGGGRVKQCNFVMGIALAVFLAVF